jgi:hypothetical protein
MEQRAVIRFVTLKSLKAKAIQVELEPVYCTDACKLSMVKKWRLLFLQGTTIRFDDPRSRRPVTQDLAEAVRSMIRKQPFASYRFLCRHFKIAKTTCLWILHDELALQKFHLRHVPQHTQSSIATNSGEQQLQVEHSHTICDHDIQTPLFKELTLPVNTT